jgi:histidinol-phosphate/aromatic aminotransferase/cobyric acid decarboxylase-like protein
MGRPSARDRTPPCDHRADCTAVRLHLNEAPWGGPPAAIDAVRDAAARVHLYPAGDTRRAARVVADYFGVDRHQVVLTTGVDEATDLCLLGLGDLTTVTPGFNGFAARAAVLQRNVTMHNLDPGFTFPVELIDRARAGDLIMVANPNNPTANLFADDHLAALLDKGCFLLLDETYADFGHGGPGLQWIDRYERLLVFRSFSKSFGLGGLRLGALIGDERLIKRLRTTQPYYPVDRLAVEGLIAAIQNEPDFPARLAERMRPLRDRLIAVLRDSELFAHVLESDTNFVLALCEDASRAHEIQRLLADQTNIFVATTAQFGLDDGVRISVGPEESIECLSEALKAISNDIAGKVATV